MVLKLSDEIQDQALTVSKLIGTQLDYLSDVQSFYAHRVSLEREYAKGLSNLALKAQQKAAQVSELLVAGEAPSKTVREGAGRQHTLDTAWQTIVTQADEEAYSRSNYAEAMQLDCVEAIKNLTRRLDLLRTQHTDFANNLLKERDVAYNVKAKAKVKYDDACKAVEAYRQKEMTAKDSRHAEKASRGKEAAMVEMWNAKNVYLLSIEVSNRMQHKYFEKDLPQIHDDMQALWTTIMARFKNIMKKQCTATTRQYEVLQRYNENGLKMITAIDAEKDQALFVDYNKRSFFPPPDFTFEPCTIWHDNSNFSLEVEPKTYLQNKLAKDENDLDEILPKVKQLRGEVTKLDELRKAYIENPALGDLDSVVEQYFHSVQQAVSAETQQETLEAEIDILHETLGDDTHPTGQAHDFKASSFPVSKTCYVCQGKIWGVSSKIGMSCRECGTNIHTSCQLLCPADCGEPSLDLARASTRASMASSQNVSSSSDGASLNRRTSYAPSTRSNLSGNGSMSSLSSSTQIAKAIYDYDAQSASQLSITAGESLTVVTPDKGNGWTKVSNEQGQTGICPTNYLNMRSSNGPPPPPLSRRPPSSSATSSSSNLAAPSYGTVTAMYAYTAGTPQELSITKGDVLELTAKGSEYAAGWTEVINKNGQKGIVPTSYVS